MEYTEPGIKRKKREKKERRGKEGICRNGLGRLVTTNQNDWVEASTASSITMSATTAQLFDLIERKAVIK